MTLRVESETLPRDWLPPLRNPLRVVLDGRGVVAEGPLLDTKLAPTLFFTTEHAEASAVDLWRQSGAEVVVVGVGTGGKGVHLEEVLNVLGERGVSQIGAVTAELVERLRLAEAVAARTRLTFRPRISLNNSFT